MSIVARENIQRTEVAVLGAGLAGLMAARRLAEAGIPVVVLEARDRVGGRLYTGTARDGTVLDLGAQWVGPTQSRVLTLAKELGATTFKTFDAGNNIQYRQGQVETYSGAIPTADRVASADIMEAMLNLNIMAGEVPLETPWQAQYASEWDSQTVHTWCLTNVAALEARRLLELAVQAVFSVEARDLSLLHLLFYIHSAGSLVDLLGVSGGAQESRFHHGAQALANKMAEALEARVVLSAPIHTVIQDKTGAKVIGDGIEVLAHHIIVAMPPALAGRLRYRPALPGYRDHLTQRVPMGAVIKTQCLYAEPFWRAAGLSGQATSDQGAVRITFDNTPERGTPGVLLGFIEGDEARVWGRRSPEDRQAAVVECLCRYFGDQAADPMDYVEQCWIEEEYSRGGYAGYMPPGAWTAYGAALREPIGCLHWAGTETATVWNGYMDGALQSGERVAAEVAAALGTKLAGSSSEA